MSNGVDIALTVGITIDGVHTNKLSMRRPKVRDMIAVDKSKSSDAQKEIDLFSNLCEINPEALVEMDLADYTLLQKTYQDFLS